MFVFSFCTRSEQSWNILELFSETRDMAKPPHGYFQWHTFFISVKNYLKKKKLLKWKRLLSTWLFCCWRWQRVIYVTIKYKCTFYKGNTLLCRWKLKLSWVEESCQWLWFVLYHPWWDQWKGSCFFLFCFLAVRFMLIVEEGWGDAVEENPKCWKSKRR